MRSYTDRRHAIVAAAVVVSGLGMRSVSSAAKPSQDVVFSSSISSVRVDVSVRQNGRPVSGLTAADFEVLDNGVRQQIQIASMEHTSADVVLALDMSGSVQGSRLEQLRTAGRRLLALLEPGDRSALITFTERVSMPAGLTHDPTSVASALGQPIGGRDTALVDAAHAALVVADSASGRPIVIVFSDGADTASFLTPTLVLDTARRTNAVVYAVTSPVAEPGKFVDDLVRLTGGRRLDVSSTSRLSEAFEEILREVGERYLLSYTPKGVRAGGWHTLTVRVPGRRVELRARPGYLGR